VLVMVKMRATVPALVIPSILSLFFVMLKFLPVISKPLFRTILVVQAI